MNNKLKWRSEKWTSCHKTTVGTHQGQPSFTRKLGETILQKWYKIIYRISIAKTKQKIRYPTSFFATRAYQRMVWLSTSVSWYCSQLRTPSWLMKVWLNFPKYRWKALWPAILSQLNSLGKTFILTGYFQWPSLEILSNDNFGLNYIQFNYGIDFKAWLNLI